MPEEPLKTQHSIWCPTSAPTLCDAIPFRAASSKSTGSRDEFGTHAEVELKTDEYTGVQVCGVWVPTEVTAFGETQAKRETDRQMERTTKQNQRVSHRERHRKKPINKNKQRW